MDGSKKITVTSGAYMFEIIDNTLFSRDKTEIYSRNFKIGGTYPDCVNVSIIYEDNKPVDASMPILLRLCTFKTPKVLAPGARGFATPSAVMDERGDSDCAFKMRNCVSDPECSLDKPLEKGSGAIIMIKTLLNYVYSQLPTLAHIKFDDKSSIECATEEEVKRGSKYRKKGTYVKPMPLYYFSILFNGETWYEKYFNAEQKDEGRHEQYRKKVIEFLYSPEFKSNMQFDRFVSLFDKREEEMAELYQYYENTTFHDFFQSIPKQQRCRLVGPWIEKFMKFILKDVFYNENWLIRLPLTPVVNRRVLRGGNKTRKYYCPKGLISNDFRPKNVCITPEEL